ncbi:hypothetical protein [uncultured Xanthomonas sp.]|uniref:hypothetical protein n=1 Tax=uncultured Xanthomonas sp. TaxID=152831 RepID=UPI0025FAE7A9|nr:hypothetical protein [uncultured Xanthomonas sp.]
MKGIYVDDERQQALTLVGRLRSEELSIEVLDPEADILSLATQIAEARPNLVLIDYRLDQNVVGDAAVAVGYRAAPLAQQLRDKSTDPTIADFPIVLISSEDKIRSRFRPEKTAHDLFDWMVIKAKVGKDPSLQKVLVGLAKGYNKLHSLNGKYNDLSIFGIDESFDFLVDHQELNVALGDAEYPHIAARYVLSFMIKRQGILVDRANLYARLGVLPPEGLALEAVNTWLGKEKYQGVFFECRDCWWSALVDERLRETFKRAYTQLSATERAHQLGDFLGVSLEAASDPWTNSSAFSPTFACACCKLPTPLSHSLACFDSRIPSFVQRLRVCYKCIQTDRLQEEMSAHNDDHQLQIDVNEEFIARRLRAYEMRPEDA